MAETHTLPEFDAAPVLDRAALRRHVLSIGDQGRFASQGGFPCDENTIEQLLDAFESTAQSWERRRLVLYAHGGGIDEQRAIDWSAIRLGQFLKDQIYPIALVWHSDKWSQLHDAVRGVFAGAKADTATRERGLTHIGGLDNRLREGLMRLTSSRIWIEIQDDAREASETPRGAMRHLLSAFKRRYAGDANTELHLIGYSAGGIFQAHVVALAAELNLPITSCVLWGPGCSIELFTRTYRRAIERGDIGRFALYNLLDEHELRDATNLGYKGSILFAVCNALEREAATPLLGLERCIEADAGAKAFLSTHPKVTWVRTPADTWSCATQHKDFDDDPVTVGSTKRFILGVD